MITSLARATLDNRLLVLLGVVALTVVGVRAYQALPIDAVPDVTNTQVQVLTPAPGLSPSEVEQLVTYPVELAMTGLPRVSRLRSVSRSGVSAVTVVFDDAVDLQLARSLVSQRLSAARERLPHSAGRPELGPLTTGLGEVYHFTVRWPGHSLTELRTLLDWEIAYRLRSVPGVVEVNAWGGDTREVEVRLRPEAMLAAGVTAAEVEEAVLAGGQTVSAGAIERDEEGTFVRADASYRSAEDVARQVLATRGGPGVGGTPLLVRDVAEVRDGAAPRLSAATADGAGETIYTMVQMIAGGNAHEIVSRVKGRLAEIQATLPAGVEIQPFYDRASFVDRVLKTVGKNLLEGGIVVALVLFLLLGDWRAGLVVASAIPLSMLGAFAAMHAVGVSGNLLSLGAIDFGMVVDGAVFVVESALTTMALHHVDGRRAMARVAAELGRPVTFGVLIIAVVYLPILLLEGVEGRMFRPMALTVLFALGTALLLTFTWVPVIGSLVLRRGHAGEPYLVRWARRVYEPALARFVLRWKLAAGGLLALTLAGAVVAGTRGAEFVPRLEEGDLAIQVTRPPSVSLAEAIRGTTALEVALRRFPEVDRVVSRTGSPDVATDIMGVEMSDVFVLLKPASTWRTAHDASGFAQAFEPVVRRALPGTSFAFTQPIEMRLQELIGGVRSDVGVKIFGEDLAELRRLGDEIARVLRATPGSADVRVEPTRGLRAVTIRPRSDRMARLGVRTDDLLRAIETLRSGRPLGRLVAGERRFDVMMRLEVPPAPDEGALRQMRIPLQGGRSVLLGDVAEVELLDGPAQISREQARRRVLVEANVRARDLAGFAVEVERRVRALALPPGYWIELGGEYENLARASRRLGVVVPATLALILVLLYLSFSQIGPALLIFLNVPAAAAGGFFALFLLGLDLSISAAVGFLALFGVAMLNGVVLLAAVRRKEADGLSRLAATTAATSERFRAVLTTAMVAALGFLPMALATGTGAEVQRPLATVVIGGLVTSTLATLFSLPALYVRFASEPSPSPAVSARRDLAPAGES